MESEALTGGNSLTMVDTEYGKFGIGICYDIRFPEMAMIAARKGAVAMIYPGAFNTVTGPLHCGLYKFRLRIDIFS
jgi:predicted amidohydrolase